jgi:hypothetical protein
MRVAALLIAALLIPAFVPAAHAETPGEKRVWDGFMKLGMDRDKAWCFSQVISQMLDPQETGQAAAIVESAPNGDAVQQGVMNAGGNMINAFSAANNTCGQ